MSHTVTLQMKIKDRDLFEKVAKEKGYLVSHTNKASLFNDTIEGDLLSVKLPDWRYPIIVDKKGNLYYDNYGGRWGKTEVLNELVQDYATSLVKKIAKKKGYAVMSVKNSANGDRVIKIAVGG